jgi:hypothetical protein
MSSGGSGAYIGETTVNFQHINGKLAFVIWINKKGSSHSSGGGGGPTGVRFNGQEGQWVKWQGEIPEGQTGTVTINDLGYDLSRGALFLVTVENDKAKIRQLERDLSAVEPSQKGLETLAKTDPEVARFVADAAKAK